MKRFRYKFLNHDEFYEITHSSNEGASAIAFDTAKSQGQILELFQVFRGDNLWQEIYNIANYK